MKTNNAKVDTLANFDIVMPFSTLNNETFYALFNYASIGILIANANGQIQMANKYVEQQFGYDEGELIGEKVEILIPRRLTERHEKHRSGYSQNPHSRPMGLGMELWGVKKNGAEFPVEVSLGHYHLNDENFSLAFINDITQRKETEQAIVQLNTHLEEKVKEGSQSLALTVAQLGNQIKETERKDKELERVNSFLNNIWNHAGAIICVANTDGVIQFFNPAAELWLGYQASDVVNKMSMALLHQKEELQQRAHQLSLLLNRNIIGDFDVLREVAEQPNDTNNEWHYVREDGSAFFVSLNITPLRDPSGAVSGYLGIAIDISEKKKAEAELLTALEKERELNELKSRFVSMASHEFRTPLSAVLSSAYLLSRYQKTEEQPQREKHIQRIVSSVHSLTEILNDFLSVGKIEEGNISPSLREYDVNAHMNDIIHDVQHLLKKGQEINYLHTSKDIIFKLDPSMMKHIVVNLLSNAIKFSEENTAIRVSTEIADNKLKLVVHDGGIGIPQEDIASLYKKFFRSSNATNIQGTGLGLHIVAKYAELLNGIIDCDSKLGEGTKFTITFMAATS